MGQEWLGAAVDGVAMGVDDATKEFVADAELAARSQESYFIAAFDAGPFFVGQNHGVAIGKTNDLRANRRSCLTTHLNHRADRRREIGNRGGKAFRPHHGARDGGGDGGGEGLKVVSLHGSFSYSPRSSFSRRWS